MRQREVAARPGVRVLSPARYGPQPPAHQPRIRPLLLRARRHQQCHCLGSRRRSREREIRRPRDCIRSALEVTAIPNRTLSCGAGRPGHRLPFFLYVLATTSISRISRADGCSKVARFVWEAIRAGAPRGIAEKVLIEQPDSKYFPYLSTMISRYAVLDQVAIISRAIELHPNSPVATTSRSAME